MNIKVKKIIAVSLCVLLVLPMLFVGSFAAVSETAGMDAIRAQWTRGEGPKAGGYDIDYSCFSPVENGASAGKKYPLVVILPGFGESSYEGEELTANDFPLWSAAEYQEKFHNGGAYIMIARAPEESVLFWDSAAVIPGLKAAIDDYCTKNPNVDTKRIYVMGWSLGASGAAMLTSDYNNFIAAAVIFSPRYIMSESEAVDCRNKAVWVFACKSDAYSIYSMYAGPMWNSLKSNTADASKIRLTTTETAPMTLVLANHNTWNMALKDMSDNGGCTGVKTVDGTGAVVDSPSLIGWLSEQCLVDDEVNLCSHICHKDGFMGFLYQIVRFFWQLFGMEKTCSCGKNHY